MKPKNFKYLEWAKLHNEVRVPRKKKKQVWKEFSSILHIGHLLPWDRQFPSKLDKLFNCGNNTYCTLEEIIDPSVTWELKT